ncbi:hypothetical protein [Ralstonia syzygii]|uniref:hypothetical protein n=1 Tax=Ralstonia syzygii TaxID=28097 RepID=UPI0018D0686E|nr:hypothetical protein [Ralstonia syzygii]
MRLFWEGSGSCLGADVGEKQAPRKGQAVLVVLFKECLSRILPDTQVEADRAVPLIAIRDGRVVGPDRVCGGDERDEAKGKKQAAAADTFLPHRASL